MNEARTNEKYVRERWVDPDKDLANFNRNLYPAGMDDWEAVYDFTLAREEQIREVEEEIALLEGWRFVYEHLPAANRILAREQAALTELRKGMQP